MRVAIACISCQESFDARSHPGLVRCAPCEDRLALRLPSVGAGITVVFDTPGEAWA